MEILPSEYQQLELDRTEKMFIRYAESCNEYGYVFLNTNPAMIQNEKQHLVITKSGIVLVKFFEKFSDASMFAMIMKVYYQGIYVDTINKVKQKLQENRALVSEGTLKVKFSYICIFPNLSRDDVEKNESELPLSFIEKYCFFKEDFSELKRDFYAKIENVNESVNLNVSGGTLTIDDSSINSILQRVAPEYIIIRVSGIENKETLRGVDDELLIVTPDDIAVRAYRLEKDQINIVNSIMKGNQLILACAGSGKSVLLISKCFKAARMNPDKKFLITCRSKQLMSLYSWYIDRAGLRERNVECMTFHGLCKRLAFNNKFALKDITTWSDTVAYKMSHNQIKDRYYGIFIDEVQLFENDWYKICFNLLENRESNEHLFVICGDKTQEIKNKQRHGKAPWNAGENYPNYRGGHKSIRIEKNYRNCLEINNYINRYAEYAKQILKLISEKDFNDPDLFLRGKSIRPGIGTYLKNLTTFTSKAEAECVMASIKQAHDIHRIPYDEIAVVIYNRNYSKKMSGWDEKRYTFERQLIIKMLDEDIPHCSRYSDSLEQTSVGNSDGVSLISFDSVLGLDFRAVIVCGLKPLGVYDKTKELSVKELEKNELDDTTKDNIRKNISLLYVACTRARDVLYLIQPEKNASDSLYMDLLASAIGEDLIDE